MCLSLSLSVSGDSGGGRCWLAGATGESQPGQCQSVLTETPEPADSVTLTGARQDELSRSIDLCRADSLTQTGCCLKYFQTREERESDTESDGSS